MELKAEVWSRVHGETLLPIAGSATCLTQPRYTCLDMIACTVGSGKCPTGNPQSDRGNSLVKCPSSEVCRIDNQNYLKCNFLSVIWCFENWPWGSTILALGSWTTQLRFSCRLSCVFSGSFSSLAELHSVCVPKMYAKRTLSDLQSTCWHSSLSIPAFPSSWTPKILDCVCLGSLSLCWA